MRARLGRLRLELPSSAPSWSWTPSTPTRHVVCAGTSTGSRLSTSSTPLVSVPWAQGGVREWQEAKPVGPSGDWMVPRRPGGGSLGGLTETLGGTQASGAPERSSQHPGHGQGVPRQPLPAWPPGALSTPHAEHLLSTDARLTPLQFGNLQKLDGPTEQCQDPPSSPASNCTDVVSLWPLLPQGQGAARGTGSGFPGWGLGCPGERGSPSSQAAEDTASSLETPTHLH